MPIQPINVHVEFQNTFGNSFIFAGMLMPCHWWEWFLDRIQTQRSLDAHVSNPLFFEFRSFSLGLPQQQVSVSSFSPIDAHRISFSRCALQRLLRIDLIDFAFFRCFSMFTNCLWLYLSCRTIWCILNSGVSAFHINPGQRRYLRMALTAKQLHAVAVQ